MNILRFLIENQEKTFSIRQIALQRKINYKSAHEAVKALAKEGCVTLDRRGNSIFCSFNRRSFGDSVFEVEHARLQELLKNKSFLVLYNRLAGINAQFILLLFGSRARGRNSKHSDTDLLMISDAPEAVERQVRLLPPGIHLTAITYGDFATMLKSREFTVVSEAVMHNVPLFGVEDYYRLMKNSNA